MNARFEQVWEILEPLLPKHEPKPHPLGCHRPRIPDKQAAEAIWYVMENGCLWKALDKTTLCKHSTAHRRFQEWVQKGVFLQLFQKSRQGFDCLVGIDWQWLCIDGVMNKAPLGGGKNRQESGGSRQTRGQAVSGHRRPWRAAERGDRRRQHA